MKTIVALFEDLEDARDAVEDLVDNGIPRADINLVARDVESRYSRYFDDEGRLRHENRHDRDDTDGEEIALGAAGGAVIGGLAGVLIGMGLLAIPGLGPIIAAGPIAAGLSGAALGAVTGGLLGALVDLGVPEEHAGYYAEGVRRGSTMVAVKVAEHQVEEVTSIMDDHDPVDLERRVEYWRSEDDWRGYNTEAEPYTSDQIRDYRQRINEWDGDTASTSYEGTSYADRSYSGSSFSDHEQEFRTHFDRTFSDSGYTYTEYMPAYRYGYDMASDNRYQNADWNAVAPEARRRWDERDDGPWEEFKDAIRHGWDRAKDAVGIGDDDHRRR